MPDPFQLPSNQKQWIVAGLAALVGLLAGGTALNFFTKVAK